MVFRATDSGSSMDSGCAGYVVVITVDTRSGMEPEISAYTCRPAWLMDDLMMVFEGLPVSVVGSVSRNGQPSLNCLTRSLRFTAPSPSDRTPCETTAGCACAQTPSLTGVSPHGPSDECIRQPRRRFSSG